MCTEQLLSQILMNLGFSREISEKFSNTKFKENPRCGNRVVPCGRKTDGQTDIKKLIVAFRHLENALKKKIVHGICMCIGRCFMFEYNM
jgi:hypothetical protein